MSHCDLLLPARTRPSWRPRPPGGGEKTPAETGDGVFRLDVRPGDYTPFSSFLAASRSLLRHAGQGPGTSRLRAATAELSEIHRKCASEEQEGSLEGAIVQHRGVLAALRRVSRESAQLCTAIHRASVALLEVLETQPARVVLLPAADRLDRPSLKLFGRCCLLAPEPSPPWEWWFEGPTPDGRPRGTEQAPLDLWCRARSGLFTALRTILDPRGVEADPDMRATPDPLPDAGGELAAPIADACAWLAHQNYDACFLWAAHHPAWTDGGSAGFVDLRRLLAIAAINIGQYDRALELLRQAHGEARPATLRAHLAYLVGLIHAKRKQDLARSARWYQKGLAELERVQPDDPGDSALERAWILNGIALNLLLRARFRRRPIRSVFTQTYATVLEAFDLVREGRTPDRMYLRYNLLGNMGSLMEIQGEYDVALKLAEDTFDPALAEGLANEQEWRAMLTSRRAMLHAKRGDLETARALFAEARSSIEAAGCAVRTEILERSVGILDLRLGAWGRARERFARGLECSLALRSRRGTTVHGGGLVVALREGGEPGKARQVYERLAETEGVWLAAEGTPAVAAVESLKAPERPHGLSLSIPEIDLEDMAKVSVAQLLQRPAEARARAEEPLG